MRPEDWPALLDGYIEQARAAPFAWGSNDCVSFTCGWHKLMTGRDAYAEFRGTYDSETAGYRIMLDHGVRGEEEAGRFLFGEPRSEVSFVQRGDIVFAEGGLGICTGANAAFSTRNGLLFLPSRTFVLAWSV